VITRKSPAEIALMRDGGRRTARVLQGLAALLRPGMTTGEIGGETERLAGEMGIVSAWKGYMGYPAGICVSVNEEVVHGIPGKRELREGDIVALDYGALYRGFYSDSTITVAVGDVSAEAQRLMDVTREALARGIAAAVPGNRVGDISHAVQGFVEENGFTVVKAFVGHGIGRRIHEDPQVPNFGDPGTGAVLREGMTMAIEPMVNQGTDGVRILPDGWTAVTADGMLSAQYEHTVAVTAAGPVILTSAGEE
jgi:methionyl aminopeptidase